MPVATTPKQIAKVLIVDDDGDARERLRSSFEKAGYRALSAVDAPSALRSLNKESCDLVVLDLEMPEVDGLMLCKLLRAQPATSKMPIIALSDNDVESRKIDAFAAGADEFISKLSPPSGIISRSARQL